MMAPWNHAYDVLMHSVIFVSTSVIQAVRNFGDNVLTPIPADEAHRFATFLIAHDFSANSRRAFVLDLR